ncbi:transmembrane protein 45B-like [Eublepharis macularius]|uniref:Transmembrane protein 45B-like n=1 Tax=Eublepharis macularius TaxID=481883 RepID=A0AA97J3G5_EUBMA|nr:transmembrane protein 45B-like [Eublepharis macularius]
MGTFAGHVLPGSFFLLFGVWWSVKYPLKYVCQKKKNTSYLGSKQLHRFEFAEGIYKALCALIGMLAEQFGPDGPQLKLYNDEKKQWVRLVRWQHTTIYLFYGISGVMDMVASRTKVLPGAMDRMVLSLALFVESFQLYYHIQNQVMLERHLHQLLLPAITGAAVCIFLEILFNDVVVFKILKTSLCILQGSWLWQMAFVFDPPSGSPEWNQMDHDNVMFLTMCYCGNFAFALTITIVNYTMVTWIVHSKMKQVSTMEVGLLKMAEHDQESEDEI